MQHILLLVTYHTKPNTRETFVEEVTDLGILRNKTMSYPIKVIQADTNRVCLDNLDL